MEHLNSIGKTRSYKPNRRGGRAHGGGGDRSDDKSHRGNFKQSTITRGRGQSRGRGGWQNASNNASNTTSSLSKRPDLGMFKKSIDDSFMI